MESLIAFILAGVMAFMAVSGTMYWITPSVMDMRNWECTQSKMVGKAPNRSEKCTQYTKNVK